MWRMSVSFVWLHGKGKEGIPFHFGFTILNCISTMILVALPYKDLTTYWKIAPHHFKDFLIYSYLSSMENKPNVKVLIKRLNALLSISLSF